MQLRYANKKLRRTCTEARYMQKELGADHAKALKLRLNELRIAHELQDLLLFGGKWEQLVGDRSGQWSARVSKNWRLIVQPESGNTEVLIVELVDYH